MASIKMRNEMEASVYSAATLACPRSFAAISAVDTHWAIDTVDTVGAANNAVAGFGTKRQRLKERFD